MSRRGVICEEPPTVCEMCGAVEELRPYGPRGENVCFSCGMKDRAAAEKRFRQHVLGEDLDS